MKRLIQTRPLLLGEAGVHVTDCLVGYGDGRRAYHKDRVIISIEQRVTAERQAEELNTHALATIFFRIQCRPVSMISRVQILTNSSNFLAFQYCNYGPLLPHLQLIPFDIDHHSSLFVPHTMQRSYCTQVPMSLLSHIWLSSDSDFGR